MASTYSHQLANGIMLPKHMLPEMEICTHGCKLDQTNTVLANTGIIIYTETEVLEFKEHKDTAWL